MRMHSARSDASTFPPDSTMQAEPLGGASTRPHRTAATAGGPGALDDELRAVDQVHHRLGDLVVGDRHDVVHVLVHELARQPRWAA